MADGATLAHRAGSSARDRIAFLGHATVLIECDGVRLLTDPLLRGRVAHLRRQTPPVEESVWAGWAGTDAVLISHLHRDHLDLASLRLLGLDTSLLVPAGAGGLLRRRGFTDVTELSAGAVTGVVGARAGADTRAGTGAGADAGAGMRADADAGAGTGVGTGTGADAGAGMRVGTGAGVGAGMVTVTAVEARHDGRRRPGGPCAETLGYVIGGRRTVYFAGDTELFDGMSELTPAPASVIDVALLPVAGWGPKLGPGHMDPLDAARAVCLLQPRIAIPVHWGTLLPIAIARRHRERLGDPPRLFARHVARLAPGVEVRILEPGQETTLTDPSRR